jgi:hypothetical protein
MKLPTIQNIRYNTPGVAKSDVGLALSEGRTATNMAGAATGLAEQWTSFSNNLAQRRDIMDLKEADRQRFVAMTEFEKKMEGRDYIDIEEIPEEVLERAGVRRFDTYVNPNTGKIENQRRMKIPAHEVRAELYKDYMDKVTKAAGSVIRNPHGQAEWAQNVAVQNENEYRKQYVAGALATDEYDKAKDIEAIKEAVDMDNGDLALELINRSSHSEEWKKQAWKMARGIIELNHYDKMQTMEMPKGISDPKHPEIINAMTAMESAARYVSPNNDDYSGELDYDKRRIEYERIMANLGRFQSAREAMTSGNMSLIEDDARRAIDRLQNGMSVDQEFINTTMEAMKASNKLALTRELMVTNSMQGPIKSMYGMSRRGRNELASAYKAEAIGSGSEAIFAKVMEDSAVKANAEFDRNSMQYVKDRTKIAVSPLNFDSQRDLQESVAERVIAYRAGKTHFGEANSFFTDDEIEYLSEQLSKEGNYQTKLNLLGAINDGIGDRETMLTALNQLRTNNMDSTFIAAGELVGRGKRVFAAQSLRGAEIRKKEKQIIGEGTMIDFRNKFNDLAGTTFAGANNRSEVFNSALNIYAFHKDIDGDYSGEYDKTTFETAVDKAMAQRKVANYKGSDIFLPDGMDERSLKSWLDNISPDDIKAAGGTRFTSASDVVAGIKNGDLKLINDTDNKVLVYDYKNHRAVMDKSDSPLTLDFTSRKSFLDIGREVEKELSEQNKIRQAEKKEKEDIKKRVESAKRMWKVRRKKQYGVRTGYKKVYNKKQKDSAKE